MVRKIKFVAPLAILISFISGCGQNAQVGQPAPVLVGADRDEHGCIGSAGYTWCAREASCVRSWELAQTKGFANRAEAFGNYCSSVAP